MGDFWRRFRAPFVFGVLIVAATAMMLQDRRSLRDGGSDLPWWQSWVLEVAVPVQKLVTAPIEATTELWSGYVALIDVHEENDKLRGRIAELEEENLQFREALVASGHLQHIAEMRDDFEVKLLPSEVVGLDVSPAFRAVLVDRGVEHGVHAGNPVVTDDGIVGLVTATSAHAARTMLLLDRQSAIDGTVQRSRVRGMVRGRGTRELEFEFVAREADLEPGDVVITSGMGGVYPKGIRVGRVSRVEDSGGRLLGTAILEPAVDFSRLEQVFVMLRRGPTLELLYDDDPPRRAPAATAEAPSNAKAAPAADTALVAEAKAKP